MSKYDHLDFRHLQAIVAIADAGTFTAAAAKLRLAQSALSRRIKDVEDFYAIQIFERDREGATPTPAGETLTHYARATLQGRVEIVDVVQAIQQASLRPFRLGFTSFIEYQALEIVTETFQNLFPSGRIQPEGVDTNDVVGRLEKDELDAALVTLPLIPDGYMVQKIIQEPMVVCIRKDDPLAEFDALPAKSLNGKLAMFGAPRHHPLAHANLLKMLMEMGVEPRVEKTNFNREQVQWMVSRGFAIALIGKDEPLLDDLTTRPIEGVNWTIDSALVYHKDHSQLALPLLVRDLSERFSDDRGSGLRKPPARASAVERQQKLAFAGSDEAV